MMGSLESPALNYQVASDIAQYLKFLGINMNFAPDCDVISDPLNRVISTRSYSSNEKIVSAMVKQFSKGHYDYGIIPVAKHFPGHGMTPFDSHLISGKIRFKNPDELNRHLFPFISLIQGRNLSAVMSAHVIYEDLDNVNPSTFSKKILSNLLRDQLGFSGIVITDDLEMEGALDFAKKIEHAYTLAFKAGADVMMIAHTLEQQEALLDRIHFLFTNGTLSETELDIKVKRIISVKQKYLYTFYNQNNSVKFNKSIKEKIQEKIILKGITDIKKSFGIITGKKTENENQQKSEPLDYTPLFSHQSKGCILSPTYSFTLYSKKYLPGWEIIEIGYFPSPQQNKVKLEKMNSRLNTFDFFLVGCANDRQALWVKKISELNKNYGLFIIENPFYFLQYREKSKFMISSFAPYPVYIKQLFFAFFNNKNLNFFFPFIFSENTASP